MISLRTRIAESAGEMDRFSRLWGEMLVVTPHSIFQRYGWNRLAAQVFRDRLTPAVVAVESDSGAAIVPAAVHHKARRLELLGEALFDYRDVLCVGDREVLRLAWERLAGLKLPLSVISVEAPSATAGWQEFPLEPFASAPQVRHDLTGEEEFRAAHSRLGRQFRRMQKKGVFLRDYSGSDAELVRCLYSRKSEQFANDSNNIFCDAARRDFMVAVAAAEGERCDIFTLETPDDLVAGLVTFREAEWRRFYTIYFDPKWARYSPGAVLIYEATAQSIACGLSCDYMTGEHPYKMRFANSSRPLYRVETNAEQLADITSRTTIEGAAYLPDEGSSSGVWGRTRFPVQSTG